MCVPGAAKLQPNLLLCYLQVVSNAKAWNSLALQLLIQLLKVLPVDFTYVSGKFSLLTRQGIATALYQST